MCTGRKEGGGCEASEGEKERKTRGGGCENIFMACASFDWCVRMPQRPQSAAIKLSFPAAQALPPAV